VREVISAEDETVLCLLNGAAHSGAAEAERAQLSKIFEQLGCEARIETPPDCERLEQMAREAVRRGVAVVIAGGGDGTISAVANALAGSQTALGVLPLGTLNHFARDIGVPLEMGAAVANALQGRTRTVDVGEVNGRVFVNNSSIGLYPQVVRERDALQEGGHSKWIAFAQALLATLRRSKSLRVRLLFAKRRLNINTDFVFIGNNEYELAVPRLGARARLDGGILWVCHLPHAGRFRAVAAAVRAIFGVERPTSPLAFTAPELRIESRRKVLDVAMDGEVLRMTTPLVYRSRPQALRVIVPAERAR
jgi:diacylglycerol kinase family enzyme